MVGRLFPILVRLNMIPSSFPGERNEMNELARGHGLNRQSESLGGRGRGDALGFIFRSHADRQGSLTIRGVGGSKVLAMQPQLEDKTNEHFKLSLVEALAAATHGAAYSRFADSWTGRLHVGMQADFVVLETDWSARGLLNSRVLQTWRKGSRVF